MTFEILSTIKPGETEIMFADRINTAGDLQIALAKVEMLSNQNLDEINIEELPKNDQPNNRYMLKLERECLTDGSIVYNVLLGYAPIPSLECTCNNSNHQIARATCPIHQVKGN